MSNEFTHEWIAKREQLEQAATDGPWVREWDTSDQWWTIHGQPNPAKCDDRMVCPEVATLNHREEWTADVDLIVDARTSLPAALAALKAVLGLHRAGDGSSQGYTPDGSYGYIEPYCAGCEATDEYAVSWPCPTVRAIEAALRGDL